MAAGMMDSGMPETIALNIYGNRTIRSSEVRQLQVRERVHRARPATSTSYEVQVLTTCGRSLTLVKGIDTQAQGLFIEQQIEKYLKIKELPGCAVVHDGAGRGAPGDAGK